MSEQSVVWSVNQGNMYKKCPKYDLMISECLKGIACKECIGEIEIPPKIETNVKRKRKKRRDRKSVV